MIANRWTLCGLLVLCVVLSGCRDKRKRLPMSDSFPSWIPLMGRPLPGHGGRKPNADAPYRRLTLDELKAVAYAYHPRISVAEMDVMNMDQFDQRYWGSPERIALERVRVTGYAHLAQWQALCRAVAKAVPPGYLVAERTPISNDPTYLLVVDAPVPPGTKEQKFLLVFVSFLVPYYTYFEVHSRRVPVETQPDIMARYSPEDLDDVRELGGFIERDPWVFEVTPVFAQVLAAVEWEIEQRFGYYRMIPDVAQVEVPGIFINGYDGDLEGIPPVLRDALFSPHGW